MLDVVKNSLYYNFLASRADFDNYYDGCHSAVIEKKSGPITAALNIFLSDAYVQKITRVVAEKKGQASTFEANRLPTYQDGLIYKVVSLFRNIVASFSFVLPSLKTY